MFGEVGQYLMTKDTAEISQFYAVACREYGVEIRIISVNDENSHSLTRIANLV